MNSGYLFFNKNELDKSIYRIFDIKYFCDLVQTKKNTIVHPKKWDDPFENHLLNHPVQTKNGKAYNYGRKLLYGQCWSLCKQSDALWRIYSPDKNGVKVTTSVRKLFQSFKKSFELERNKHSYIGKVQYYNPEKVLTELINKFEDTPKWSLDGSLEAKQLLFKRNAFSYESEIRLIGYYFDKYINTELLKYKVNPFELFSEIVLDPQLDKKEFSNLKEKLVRLGFNDDIIWKSNLYTLDKDELRVLQ